MKCFIAVCSSYFNLSDIWTIQNWYDVYAITERNNIFLKKLHVMLNFHFLLWFRNLEIPDLPGNGTLVYGSGTGLSEEHKNYF